MIDNIKRLNDHLQNYNMTAEQTLNEATELAKTYKDTFGVNVLKQKLHIGTATANMILEELENREAIKQEYEPTYKCNVLI